MTAAELVVSSLVTIDSLYRHRWDAAKLGQLSQSSMLKHLRSEGFSGSVYTFPTGHVLSMHAPPCQPLAVSAGCSSAHALSIAGCEFGDHTHACDKRDAILSGKFLFRMGGEEVRDALVSLHTSCMGSWWRHVGADRVASWRYAGCTCWQDALCKSPRRPMFIRRWQRHLNPPDGLRGRRRGQALCSHRDLDFSCSGLQQLAMLCCAYILRSNKLETRVVVAVLHCELLAVVYKCVLTL